MLKQISKITKNEESLLLMDQYGSHITDKVKDYAILKNIIIKYVPIGMTSKYQPLDLSINGILKNKISEKYSKFISLNLDKKYDHAQCLQDILISLKEIKKRTIIKSFDCLKKIKK
jgi:hypothetical protein